MKASDINHKATYYTSFSICLDLHEVKHYKSTFVFELILPGLIFHQILNIIKTFSNMETFLGLLTINSMVT